MKIYSVVCSLLLIVVLPLSGCGSNFESSSGAALSADNVNLIFVVSPDLAYQSAGDLQPETANLSNQGFQRSLQLASYLKTQVLGGANVSSISALQPMTHLQTAHNFPDMAGIGFIQQFALLNQITLPVDNLGHTHTANSYIVGTSYASGSVPSGTFVPNTFCPDCQGLDFNNIGGNNEKLLSAIIKKNVPGHYVFSAPWETISALLAKINSQQGYQLNLPTSFMGTNYVYAISIAASGEARLLTYNSDLNPPNTYPVLPGQISQAACTYNLQANFSTTRSAGMDGVVIPANVNKNQTVYLIRHVEAHPGDLINGVLSSFENGNYVGAGQWRALDLPKVLQGKINPTVVYSIDPAQWARVPTGGGFNISYVRPSLSVLPYVVANDLPFHLVSDFFIGDPNVSKLSSDFFFTGGKFSNQSVLVAWESSRIKPMINALLQSYGGLPLLPQQWPSADYDTIWRVTLDSQGNLSVDNDLCEGIDSTSLPAMAPLF